jgi:hypothetical protein
MYQGTTPVSAPVTAELTLGPRAKGPALLAIAWSAGGRSGEQDACIVAPGGFGVVTVTPTKPGFLRVYVDTTNETDRATLGVSPSTPAEKIQGDTTWTYSVE